ncbi:MAG: hypothetical protein J6125_05010, partial [Clostridia bacterium]|nr:hypothetical protein [Clostridia bacterium]
KTENDRETGWLAVKELLRVREHGRPRLHIFRTCTRLIECLPALLCDEKKPGDVSTEPHEITHAPDALRGFAVYYARPAGIGAAPAAPAFRYRDLSEDWEQATPAERTRMLRCRQSGFRPCGHESDAW